MDSQQIYTDSRIKDAWRLFVSKGIVRREILRNDVAYSWVRSRLHGVALGELCDTTMVSGEILRQFQKRDESLLNIASSYVPNLSNLHIFRDVVLAVVNRDGMVIKSFNETNLDAKVLNEGVRMTEDIIGTNAIGTSLKINKDLVIYGAEHYSELYQKYVTYSCIIKNEEEEVMGVLAALSLIKHDDEELIEKLREIADTLGNELNVHVDNKKLMSINDHLDNIIDSIPDGLICVDQFGQIIDFNSKAEVMFKKPMINSKLKGENIRSFVKMDNQMDMEQMLNGSESKDLWEGYYDINDSLKPCNLEIISMKQAGMNKFGNILIRIVDLKEHYIHVNHMIGNKAYYTLNDIVGNSNEITEIRRLAKQSSDTKSIVLVNGETGSGKKVLAQAIHNSGLRRRESFYHLDCKSIPKKQIESELFGHVSSYSRTGRQQTGLIEMSNYGTLYISNVEEMPLQTQLKLLKYIEEKKFSKLGSDIGRNSDVRLIFGSKRDLELEISRGTFRIELYNRIRMVQIKMTPLRERRDDIPSLVEYLSKEISYTQNKQIKGIESCFYKRLMEYHWPGNVREMHNVMHYVFYKIKDEDVLSEASVPEHLFEGLEDLHLKTATLKIDSIEKEAIMKAIEITEENLSKAAKLLGIGRSTLYRKIEKYKIRLYQNDTLFDVKISSASK